MGDQGKMADRGNRRGSEIRATEVRRHAPYADKSDDQESISVQVRPAEASSRESSEPPPPSCILLAGFPGDPYGGFFQDPEIETCIT